MPSDLQVDNIKDGSATKTLATLSSSSVTLHNDVSFPTGSTISGQVGGGHVLQIQSTTKNDTFSVTVGSANGESAITGLSVKITPQSASNKIAVFFTVCGASNKAGRQSSFGINLYRDSTQIADPDDTGSSSRPLSTVASDHSGEDNNTKYGTVSMNFIDSPSSTSEITYSLRVMNIFDSSNDFYINRTQLDTDANYRNRTISTITVMEISA